MTDEIIILGSDDCPPCRELDRRIPKLPAGVRKVDVMSDEGADIVIALKGAIYSVPKAVRKRDNIFEKCNLFFEGNAVYVQCPRTEKRRLN